MDPWQPIPGETPIDPSGLLDKTIRTRQQLNTAEGRNIAKAIAKYLLSTPTAQEAPFDFHWLLKLHQEMFGEVWEWAGTPRKENLNLGVEHYQVETMLYGLLKNLEYWKTMPMMEQAARLHHGSVAIHPFLNGNGRWSRMLANIWLKRNGSPPTLWPDEADGESSIIREKYLIAVKAADEMDFAPLIELHTRYTPHS